MQRTLQAVSATILLGLLSVPAVGAQGAPAPQTESLNALLAKAAYTWWGELVSTDGATITVKLPLNERVATYTDRFKPGDHLVLTWAVREKGVANDVIYVTTYDVMKNAKADYGYILPAEFVSADVAGKTMTVKTAAPAATLQAVKSVAPGKTIKVTMPMLQPNDSATITAIEASERPAPAVQAAPKA